MPVLSYFNFPGGRGEDCRIALHMAGVDFVDNRINGPDWGALKASTPYGALPVYEEDGVSIGQSNAILAYLGRKHELHPSDPFEAARHESVMGAVEDLRFALPGGSGLSDEDKKSKREAFAAGYLQSWAANLESQVQGPFLSGDVLNVADLKLFVGLSFYLNGGVDHVGPEAFQSYPKLLALVDAAKDHDGVKSWYAKS